MTEDEFRVAVNRLIDEALEDGVDRNEIAAELASILAGLGADPEYP